MRENPYPGVNAHLNSLLQTPGTRGQPSLWHSFHARHIGHIADALSEQLPDHYLALSEQSLQISDLDSAGFEEIRFVIPDVDIFQMQDSKSAASIEVALKPTWEGSFAEILDPPTQPRSVVIREVLPQQRLGRVVARIELLSPSNKRGGRHYASYRQKRVETISDGVPLIEIDYLHEIPSLISQLPQYPAEEDAYPYSIIISDPRPDWYIAKVKVYGFGVDEPIRLLPLPLAGQEVLIFDLNTVYQRTFKIVGWGTLIDYALEPERFHTYRPADQAYILALMERVASATPS